MQPGVRRLVAAVTLQVGLLLGAGSAAAQAPAGAAASRPASSGPVVLASAEVFQAVSQFYRYDTAAPLQAELLGKQTFPAYTREKISFAGFGGSRVPGYLALPRTGTGPFPVVLLIDGVGGSKERWFQDDSWPRGPLLTNALTGAGIAVLALDARFHGERAAENGYRNPRFSAQPADRDMIAQSIVEHRRALDYLATRPEIDTTRIGALGLSMGGIMTFALSAMDPRIKASVAGVTPIEPMKETIAIPIAPQTFAGAIGTTPFLMLMGRTDGFYTVADAQRLFELIPSPRKDIVFFDSGHRLPPEYATRAVEWLTTYLR
jgi:dienelactone hydrolase